MSTNSRATPLTDAEQVAMRREQDQIMGALAELKVMLGNRVSFDVHMVSGRAHVRVPHMARSDCGCGDMTGGPQTGAKERPE